MVVALFSGAVLCAFSGENATQRCKDYLKNMGINPDNAQYVTVQIVPQA